MKIIKIDSNSGFCFGVIRAIQSAERELAVKSPLYCLGDILHNNLEMERLRKIGLKIITHQILKTMYGERILIHAHGEPPSTYEIAYKNNIQIIDTTCPVVLNLQKKIKKIYQSENKNRQIVIFGKLGHEEVDALVGQTEGNAIVIKSKEDFQKLNFNKNVYLFSQTTRSVKDFKQIVKDIQNNLPHPFLLFSFNTICHQVVSRIKHIRFFAKKYDLILFVAGNESSNGKVLLHECKKVNPNTYLIADETEIPCNQLYNIQSIGICGATSTPKWLMKKVYTSLKYSTI